MMIAFLTQTDKILAFFVNVMAVTHFNQLQKFDGKLKH
jgi:hypothetical protein